MKKQSRTISAERAMSILRKPVTTEKSTNLQQYNQYTFVVSKDSNSFEIKQAIETLFKVKAMKVLIRFLCFQLNHQLVLTRLKII